MSNERLDVDGVKAKFGVPPERIVDYLTLVGDTVDNVPGVEKVGPKTAAKWIAEHGSLDGVVAAADSIKGVAGENLRKALDWLPTGRKLITVVTDCDLSGHVPGWPALEALALREVDRDGLLDFYQRFGFKTWLQGARAGARRRRAGPAAAAAALRRRPHAADAAAGRGRDGATTRPCSPGSALDAWLARLAHGRRWRRIDTETDSLDADARAHRRHLASPSSPAAPPTCRWRHNYPGAPEQLPLDEVLARLQPWLEDAARAKLGQNIKYDPHVLANAGITVRGYAPRHHAAELCARGAQARTAWRALAERHLGRKGLSYEDLCGKGANQIPFAQVDMARATEYSGEDSEMTLHVHQAPVAAASRPTPGCATSTSTSRCRCRRSCSASSATAC